MIVMIIVHKLSRKGILIEMFFIVYFYAKFSSCFFPSHIKCPSIIHHPITSHYIPIAARNFFRGAFFKRGTRSDSASVSTFKSCISDSS